MVSTVLVAERDSASRNMLREALEQDGFAVEVAADSDEALAYANDFDVVVADIRLDLMVAVKARNPATEVVLVTGEKTLDDAVAAVRRGAFDYVVRPFFVEDISLTVACAAARRQQASPLEIPLGHVLKSCTMTR